MKFRIFPLLFATLFIISCGDKTASPTMEEKPTDPLNAQIYTLDNGLKVYFSVNKGEPRVQTFITVNTGSTNDPADVTGLAHYLEHMVFKGTSKFATLDWEKEKVLLQLISDLYEQHKAEKDPEKKRAIYAKIDSVSGEAAKFAIPNEYDKMISGLGAEGTNAFTSSERTAYINDIPSTELEKWMKIESERFGELVLRLFHTELEAVYEEFNRGQDSDYRKAYKAMYELLFLKHQYGTQTTIGEGEHLKNPSMEKIHEYFDKYYVPNNMAICLAGDFDPANTLELIKKYFGALPSKELVQPAHPTEDPIIEPRTKTVYGPMEEWVSVGYRLNGYSSEDAVMGKLMAEILSNNVAGLIDLNLVQKQRVLDAYCYSSTMRDYGTLTIGGNPKGGQSLEDVQALLLEQIELVKKGEFADDLLSSVIRNIKVEQLNQFEENWLRAYLMADAFIMGADWNNYISRTDKMATITKDQMIKWANKNFNNNYCVVYKKTGTDTSTFKVDKPQITPVDINRETKSPFYADLEKMESIRLTPDFVDYKTALKTSNLMEDVPFYYIQNTTNELFSLFIELDEDMNFNPKVQLAFKYLNYLGTDKKTAEDLKVQQYKLGATIRARSSSSRSYIAVSGLQESFNDALNLVEDLLTHAKADSMALTNLIADEMQTREDDKKSKGAILYAGLTNYAKYGPKNKFNNQLTDEELQNISADELIKIIKELTSYKHRVLYYGPANMETSLSAVKKTHQLPKELLTAVNIKKYPEIQTNESIVYFVDYDMVQTEMIMLSKSEFFNPQRAAYSHMFNQFFGSGLSSVVFQEIRESKALAYSANSRLSTPSKPDESHYISAYIGAQTNKLAQATDAMIALMNNIPAGTDTQFEESKTSALKQIESERIVKTRIYWNYRNLEDLGIDYDNRKEIYEQIQKMTFADFTTFFNENVAGKNYVYCVIGKKADMDMKALAKLGKVKELTLEQVFGY